MHADTGSRLVREYFSAFHSRDRKTMEDLLSDDFIFTSPFDDRIGKAIYFQRCWPSSYRIREFRIETLCDNGSDAFIRYECAFDTGPKFRNMEYFRIEGSRIKAVEVYFGSLPEEDSQE